jgi:hypothetical protein
VIGIDRTSARYQATRPDDADLRERIKTLASERRRFGYRRLHVLLRREGHAVNRKRVQRIYREERLTVRRRGGRKRGMGTRRPIETPLLPNQRWSLDFVSDQLTDGRRFRNLTVIDNCTREYLALVADTSLSGGRTSQPIWAKGTAVIQRPGGYALACHHVGRADWLRDPGNLAHVGSNISQARLTAPVFFTARSPWLATSALTRTATASSGYSTGQVVQADRIPLRTAISYIAILAPKSVKLWVPTFVNLA